MTHHLEWSGKSYDFVGVVLFYLQLLVHKRLEWQRSSSPLHTHTHTSLFSFFSSCWLAINANFHYSLSSIFTNFPSQLHQNPIFSTLPFCIIHTLNLNTGDLHENIKIQTSSMEDHKCLFQVVIPVDEVC